MKNFIQIATTIFLAIGLSSCVSVSNVIEDDVYAVKQVSLPLGESLDDETSYSAYKYKKKKNQPANEYYDGNTGGWADNSFRNPTYGMRYSSGFFMGRSHFGGMNYGYYGNHYMRNCPYDYMPGFGWSYNPMCNGYGMYPYGGHAMYDPFYSPYYGWGGHSGWGMGYGAGWGMGNVIIVNNYGGSNWGSGFASAGNTSNRNTFYGPRGSSVGTSGTGTRSNVTSGKLRSAPAGGTANTSNNENARGRNVEGTTSRTNNSGATPTSRDGRNSRDMLNNNSRGNNPNVGRTNNNVNSRPIPDRQTQSRPDYNPRPSQGVDNRNNAPNRNVSPQRNNPAGRSGGNVSPSRPSSPSPSPSMRGSGGSSGGSMSRPSGGGSREKSSPSPGGRRN